MIPERRSLQGAWQQLGRVMSARAWLFDASNALAHMLLPPVRACLPGCSWSMKSPA